MWTCWKLKQLRQSHSVGRIFYIMTFSSTLISCHQFFSLQTRAIEILEAHASRYRLINSSTSIGIDFLPQRNIFLIFSTSSRWWCQWLWIKILNKSDFQLQIHIARAQVHEEIKLEYDLCVEGSRRWEEKLKCRKTFFLPLDVLHGWISYCTMQIVRREMIKKVFIVKQLHWVSFRDCESFNNPFYEICPWRWEV